MLKKLFGSLGTSEKIGKTGKNGVDGVNAPQLTESDYEFLFLQLLEGLGHGWQQPRIISFFEEIEDRISQQQWLAWLEGLGARMLAASAPDNNLAARMVQLGEMRCGAIGDLAYDLGMKVLTRGQQPVYVDFNTDELGAGDADLLEFAGTDLLSAEDSSPDIANDRDEAAIFEFAGLDTIGASDRSAAETLPTSENENQPEFANQEIPNTEDEVKEITLAEFQILLQQDPELAKGISQELGLDRPDPESIIQALVAQAEAQASDN